jgi:hypothetical protein
MTPERVTNLVFALFLAGLTALLFTMAGGCGLDETGAPKPLDPDITIHCRGKLACDLTGWCECEPGVVTTTDGGSLD